MSYLLFFAPIGEVSELHPMRTAACYLVDCGSKSGEWGTRRRNCRRGREWCFPDGGPRGSAGRRTRELTASTSPTVATEKIAR
ncbi:hypothetical protein R6Z07F_008620 [Ovis aries]